MTETKQNSDAKSPTPGLAVFGCMATGCVAIIGALFGLFDEEYVGGGVCLIAAATSFGAVTYASFSK